MRALLLVFVLSLPSLACATFAGETEPTRQVQSGTPSPPHHQLFTVKYVLRPNRTPMPHVVVEQGAALTPPGDADRGAPLGHFYGNPNAVVCYGRGCESGSAH
jgi:hypothetical protein